MEAYKKLMEDLAYANEKYESCERELTKLQEDFQKNMYSIEVYSRCLTFREGVKAEGGEEEEEEEGGEELYAILTPGGEMFEKDPPLERLLEATKIDQEKVKALLMGARARAEKWRMEVQRLEASAAGLF